MKKKEEPAITLIDSKEKVNKTNKTQTFLANVKRDPILKTLRTEIQTKEINLMIYFKTTVMM
jgi:hypothetical protein